MDEFLQIFGGISLSTVITFIVALVFLISVGVKLYKIIVTNHDAVKKRETTLEKLQEDVKEMKKNSLEMKGEWEDLKSKQDNFSVVLNEILDAQKAIVQKQDAFEEEHRSHNRNKLRDRLLQSYKYYTSTEKNPEGAWSEMEKEAFDKLFKDYEDLGGNGFMHTTVAPEMAKLEVVSMSNQDKITDLMKSRKG